jgi:general secretion pathway protein D
MKITSIKISPASMNWRRAGVAAALLCAFAQWSPAYAAEAAKGEPAKGEAVLNFVGADIESVVKAVGHYTNMTFLIDPRVKGTISLISERPVSKSEAFGLLSSALRLQGYTVVIGDGFAKVVPEADAKLQAGPIQAGPTRARGDQIATQIFRLNYEPAASLVTVLRPLISPNNTINANPGTNSLVITDYADNLKRLGKIIAALDSPPSGDMDVVPVRHAIASDIASMVNRLMAPGPGAGAADRVSVLADSRTNSVIIRAPSDARANLAKALVAKLDQPTANPGNIHVVPLKNAQAIRLAQTLRAVISGDTASPGQPDPGQGQPQGQPPEQQQGGPGGIQSGPLGTAGAEQPGNLPAGGAAGFIQADAATNTLIITASEAVYRNLRAVIDRLDARRAQVYVESLIVEVTADRAAEFGVQWAGITGDAGSRYRLGTLTGFAEPNTGNNLISQIAAIAAPNGNPLPPGNGLNLAVLRQVGGALGLGAIARALETDGKTNILSMPNLITLDNEEARIIVGQNVPFVTGQFTSAATGGAGANPFQTIERKDVGLSLRVRPQISEGGTVKMAIYQETSSVQPRGAASDIITNKRSIETNVLVDDGEIIVLGGLIEDTASDTEEKVPGLGDIPLVGNLFKYQRRGRTKTNLMVFLRPTVIRTGEQNANIAADRYDYIREAQLKAQPEPTLVLPTMAAPTLPPLEHGRPVGGAMLQQSPQPHIIKQPSLQVVPAPVLVPMSAPPPVTTQ